jgi:hypothetical protein
MNEARKSWLKAVQWHDSLRSLAGERKEKKQSTTVVNTALV